MAQLISVKMSKFDNQPWGFRLQGGIDFAAPLTVQKVNGGSLAEKAGLHVGDALIRVNNTDIFQLRHKDAQDAVSRAGNNFELVVSRGGGMPKTAAKPSDALDIQHPAPRHEPPVPVAPVQQKSTIPRSLNLTAKPFVRSTQTTPTSVSMEALKKRRESIELTNNNYLTSPPLSDKELSFNSSTKTISSDETNRAKELITQRLAVMRIQPASPPVRNSSTLVTPASSPSLTLNKSDAVRTGFHDGSSGPASYVAVKMTDGGNVKLVNRQFNSPMGLYSEENIAETLSSQAEVLAQGVLGVNFKKNEKTYDPGNSEVFKMVQEIDRAPREPEPGIDIDPVDASPAQKGLASRTIQSRTFQRIHQQAVRSLEASSPTSPILSPNTSMEDRHHTMAHASTPTHKPFMMNSPATFPVNQNIGSGFHSPSSAHPPPIGGVRIFPAGPVNNKPAFMQQQQQVKFQESYEELKVESSISSTTTVTSSTSDHAAASSSFTNEETVTSSASDDQVLQHLVSEAPMYAAAAPPAVKPVSFAPTARSLDELDSQGGKSVVWPPVAASESEAEPIRNVASPVAMATPKLVDEPPFVVAPTEPVVLVEAPAPTPAEPVAPLPAVVEAAPPVRVPTPVASPVPSAAAQSATAAHPPGASLLGYHDHHHDDQTSTLAKQTDSGHNQLLHQQQQQQQQQHHQQQHQPSNPGLAGFGSAASAAAAAAAAASSSAAPKGSGSGIQSAPRRGKGVLNPQVAVGARVPVCSSCNTQIRGKFVTALGLTWCPNHFVCAMQNCRRELHDIGFVEEKKQLYCEGCFENFLAPNCARCSKRVKGDCLNAIGKQFHPECFACTYCGRLFGNSHFYLEDGLPYCEADWNELFTTKCYACGFPIEAGDRWVEAMNNNYHSQCFNCSVCKKNLEGQSFLGKGGRPMCKSHAR